MRHYLLVALAVLFMAGTCQAAGIPLATDPLNSPEVWTVEVYNNYGSALTSGTVVSWDCVSDTADKSYAYRTMWVTRPSANDEGEVAGVIVDDSIASGSVGTIAIWGPVYTLVADSTGAVTIGNAVACSSVLGQADQAGSASVDTGILGMCIYDTPVSTSLGGYGGTAGNDFVMLPVFVNPHIQ